MSASISPLRIDRLAQARAGIRDMAPFLISAVPLAMLGGAYGVTSGLGLSKTLLLAMCVNSGTVQFVGTKLIADGASVTALWFTTLALCLRLIFYSLLLRTPMRRLPLKLRLVLGFGLIDVIYFLVKDRFANDTADYGWQWYYIGGTGIMYVVWMTATFGGAVAGSSLTRYLGAGVDFPMTALFAAMLGASIVNWKVAVGAAAAGVLSMALEGMPYGLGIVSAALGGALFAFLFGVFATRVSSASRRST